MVNFSQVFNFLNKANIFLPFCVPGLLLFMTFDNGVVFLLQQDLLQSDTVFSALFHLLSSTFLEGPCSKESLVNELEV